MYIFVEVPALMELSDFLKLPWELSSKHIFLKDLCPSLLEHFISKKVPDQIILDNEKTN